MPSLATVKTDIDTVIADIGSTTAYASILPSDLKSAANAALKTSIINCHQLLSLLLAQAGITQRAGVVNGNQG
jgi:hypothetical protein